MDRQAGVNESTPPVGITLGVPSLLWEQTDRELAAVYEEIKLIQRDDVKNDARLRPLRAACVRIHMSRIELNVVAQAQLATLSSKAG